MSFSLDAPQRTQIEQRRQQTRDYRLAMRLSALLWCDQGKTESAIAHLLGVCERTIRNWLRLYRQKGLEALCTLHYRSDPGELTSPQAEQLKVAIQTGLFRCARQVREWVKSTFGVVYSLSGTKRLLQRLGCSFHKATGFLFKAQRVQQEEFVQKYDAARPAPGEATRRCFTCAKLSKSCIRSSSCPRGFPEGRAYLVSPDRRSLPGSHGHRPWV